MKMDDIQTTHLNPLTVIRGEAMSSILRFSKTFTGTETDIDGVAFPAPTFPHYIRRIELSFEGTLRNNNSSAIHVTWGLFRLRENDDITDFANTLKETHGQPITTATSSFITGGTFGVKKHVVTGVASLQHSVNRTINGPLLMSVGDHLGFAILVKGVENSGYEIRGATVYFITV